MNNFRFEVDGETVIVELSRHAEEQRVDRDVSLYEVEEAFILAGERILNVKVGKNFAIRKRGSYVIICQLYTEKDSYNIMVEIVTILGVNEPTIKRGIYTLDI